MALEPILYRSEETVFDEAGLQKVKVTAKVLAHVRGERLRVFKFKPKRGYKRRTGHRQDLTQIEVTDITRASAKPAAKAAKAKAPAKAAKAKAASAKGEDRWLIRTPAKLRYTIVAIITALAAKPAIGTTLRLSMSCFFRAMRLEL